MSEEAGWTSNPLALLQQRVLRVMASDREGLGNADQLATTFGVDPDDVARCLAMLEGTGDVRTFDRGLSDGDPRDAVITPRGRSVVATWETRRTPRALRRACEAAMLSWLDEHEGETIQSTDDFVGDTRCNFLGYQFDAAVRIDAARELHKRELIGGQQAWGGPVLRPEITTLGRSVVARFDGDLTEWMASQLNTAGTSITVNHSTGVNVANHSPGTTQGVTITADAKERIHNLAAALREQIPDLQLEPADQARAMGLVGQLKDAADIGEPTKIHHLLDAAKDVVTNAAGTVAGTGILALIADIGPHIHT